MSARPQRTEQSVMRRDKIRIEPGFFALLAAACLLTRPESLLGVAAAVCAHELGHCIGLKLCGAEIRGVRLGLTGAVLEYDAARLSYLREIITAVLGPAFSFLFAAALSSLGGRLENEEMYFAAGLSYILGLFNLAPVLPMDGGRILFFLMEWIGGWKLAACVSRVTGVAVSCLLFALGLTLLCGNKRNWTLCILSIWMLIFSCKKQMDGV